jgi:hypothetical protein
MSFRKNVISIKPVEGEIEQTFADIVRNIE